MQAIRPSIRGSLLLKAGLTIGLIVLGDVMFVQDKLSGGYFGGFFLALLVAMVLARPAVRGDTGAWIALTLAALFALATGYDASPLSWALFAVAAAMATILPGTGAFDDGWRWFQRLFYHGLTSCIGPLIDTIKLLRVRIWRPGQRIGLRRSLPMLGLPLIGSAVIVALFSAANPVIERILVSISLPEWNDANRLRLAIWFGLFTASWALLRPRLPRRLIATFDGSGDLALPGVSVGSVTLSLIAFNLLFAMQNAMDAAWLWELTPLPDGMTLAEYAHRGAYPLIATALLSALFVLVTLRPGSTTAQVPAIRRLVVLWIAQNLFLVLSSALRTFDYIDAYSLTTLRIAALMWMALVGAGLVLICWRMLRGRSAGWLINANLVAAGALLTGCCFVDLGAVAAQWNVRHAREVDGTGTGIDLCYLESLEGSALLPLIELERRKIPGLEDRVRIVRQGVQARLGARLAAGEWTWLGEHRLIEAESLVGHVAPHAEEYHGDCTRLYPAATLTEGTER